MNANHNLLLEVLQIIQETYLGEPWALPRGVYSPDKPDARYYRQLVNIYYRLALREKCVTTRRKAVELCDT